MPAKKKAKKKTAKKKAAVKKKTVRKSSAARKPNKRKIAGKKTAGKKAAAKKKKTAVKKRVTKKKAVRKKTASRKKPARKQAARKKTVQSKTGKKKTAQKKTAKKSAVKKKSTQKKTVPPKAVRKRTVSKTPGEIPKPKNLKPYIRKKGEDYMNPAQVEHFRRILTNWKLELMEEVDRTVHHMQDEASNFPDPNDRATQEEEFALELRTRDRERKLIKKINEALQSLESGDYGYCEVCGVEIGINRLEARPTATLCIDCKTLDEIKERQLG